MQERLRRCQVPTIRVASPLHQSNTTEKHRPCHQGPQDNVQDHRRKRTTRRHSITQPRLPWTNQPKRRRHSRQPHTLRQHPRYKGRRHQQANHHNHKRSIRRRQYCTTRSKRSQRSRRSKHVRRRQSSKHQQTSTATNSRQHQVRQAQIHFSIHQFQRNNRHTTTRQQIPTAQKQKYNNHSPYATKVTKNRIPIQHKRRNSRVNKQQRRTIHLSRKRIKHQLQDTSIPIRQHNINNRQARTRHQKPRSQNNKHKARQAQHHRNQQPTTCRHQQRLNFKQHRQQPTTRMRLTKQLPHDVISTRQFHTPMRTRQPSRHTIGRIPTRTMFTYKPRQTQNRNNKAKLHNRTATNNRNTRNPNSTSTKKRSRNTHQRQRQPRSQHSTTHHQVTQNSRRHRTNSKCKHTNRCATQRSIRTSSRNQDTRQPIHMAITSHTYPQCVCATSGGSKLPSLS